MATKILLDDLQRLLAGGAQLVEVLPEREYAERRLPGAINIPLKQLDAKSAGVLDCAGPWSFTARTRFETWAHEPRAGSTRSGFTKVYDYVPGKIDWLAHNLPVDGEQADLPTAGRVARDDAVTCRLDDGSANSGNGSKPHPTGSVW
jgi:rhodanese-related sulfurtransferase